VVGAVGLVAAIISISVGEGGPQAQRIGDLGPVQQLYGGIPSEGAELGEPGAKFTVAVFTDLRCTDCAEYQIDTVDPLVEEFVRTGEARFELRHYSLGSESTTLAAAAAVAAGEQGRQWQYADLLFRNIEESRGQVDDEFLIDVADSLPELEVDIWEEDRASERVADLVEADGVEGAELELLRDGPSVVVNGPGGVRSLGVAPTADEIRDAIAAVS
jgi:protein-disulfide isomerase